MAAGEDAHRARAVRLLLLDVDGVLTDGRFTVDADGRESKTFHARDGLGLKLLQGAGVAVGVVSGRQAKAVEHRARELGLDEVIQGAGDKPAAIDAVLQRRGLAWSQTGYVGDDLSDVPVLRRAGFAATVPEAPPEVRRRVDLVTAAGGGHGAVREVCELILKAQGRWPEVLARFDAAREGDASGAGGRREAT